MTSPPAFLILLEVLFMRRHPDLLEYAGIIVSFAGSALIIISGNHNHQVASDYLLGDCLAVCASICFAIYLLVLSKPTEKYKPISLLRWVFFFAAIPTVFMFPGMIDMPILHTTLLAPWFEITFILVGPTFLAYLLLQPAERDIGSVLVSLYQYLTPVVAAVSAVLMGLDQLRWVQVLAIVIIVAGMIMTNIGKKNDHFTASVKREIR